VTRRAVATLDGPTRSVHSVTFSPDGTTLAGTDASSGDPKTENHVMVRLWSVATGRLIAAFAVGGDDEKGRRCWPSVMIDTELAFSRDGTTLAANCGLAVRLWRLPTLERQ
jgi:WD40 repeat protein